MAPEVGLIYKPEAFGFVHMLGLSHSRTSSQTSIVGVGVGYQSLFSYPFCGGFKGYRFAPGHVGYRRNSLWEDY